MTDHLSIARQLASDGDEMIRKAEELAGGHQAFQAAALRQAASAAYLGSMAHTNLLLADTAEGPSEFSR